MNQEIKEKGTDVEEKFPDFRVLLRIESSNVS